MSNGAGTAILEALARLEAKVDRLLAGGTTATTPTSDADLDGQYGNPEVKKDPPRWKGDSHIGKRFSECTPPFLDEMASFCLWKAGKDDEQAKKHDEYEGEEDDADKKRKHAGYARTDAARARGWAARLRSGWKPPAQEGDASTNGWG